MTDLVEASEPPKKPVTLGDEAYAVCSICARDDLKGPFGSWATCPKCAPHAEYIHPAPKMSRSRFATECVALGLMDDPSKAAGLLGVDVTLYDRYDHSAGYVTDDLSRKVMALRSCPPRLRYTESEPQSPNSRYGVKTPDGVFPTIADAAEHYGMNLETARTRANRSSHAWEKFENRGKVTKIALVEKESPDP